MTKKFDVHKLSYYLKRKAWSDEYAPTTRSETQRNRLVSGLESERGREG